MPTRLSFAGVGALPRTQCAVFSLIGAPAPTSNLAARLRPVPATIDAPTTVEVFDAIKIYHEGIPLTGRRTMVKSAMSSFAGNADNSRRVLLTAGLDPISGQLDCSCGRLAQVV